MNIIRTPITSCGRVYDARPWYVFALTVAAKLTIAQANRKGQASPLLNASVDLPTVMQFAASHAVTPLGPTDRIALMITLADQLVALPERELAGEYHAHLGFYTPATDTLELLQFFEGHTPDQHAVLDAAAAAQVGP